MGAGEGEEKNCRTVQLPVHRLNRLAAFRNVFTCKRVALHRGRWRRLFGVAGLRAGFGCFRDCCGFIEPIADAFEEIRDRNCWNVLGHYGASMTTTHASFVREVERIQSNVVAVWPHSDRLLRIGVACIGSGVSCAESQNFR